MQVVHTCRHSSHGAHTTCDRLARRQGTSSPAAPACVSNSSCRAPAALCTTTLPLSTPPPQEASTLRRTSLLHHNKARAQLQGAWLAQQQLGAHPASTLRPRRSCPNPRRSRATPYTHTLCHFPLIGLWPPHPPRHAAGFAVLQIRLSHPLSTQSTSCTILPQSLFLPAPWPPTYKPRPLLQPPLQPAFAFAGTTCPPHLPATTFLKPPCPSIPGQHSFPPTSHRRPPRHTHQTPQGQRSSFTNGLCLWAAW